MLNQEFGFINEALFGGADIPWLTDPWLAKFSVLLVNTWLGFPYMFLVCTGALQSLPEDVNEAARMDGLTPWQIFWRVTLPLLRPAILIVVVIRAVDALRMVEREIAAHMAADVSAGRAESRIAEDPHELSPEAGHGDGVQGLAGRAVGVPVARHVGDDHVERVSGIGAV